MSADLQLQLKQAQAELQQARADLQRVRDEYQEFTYIVSHDLSGPLRQIEGFAGIVSENNADELNEKTQRHLDLISKGARQGKRILDALLGYSRLNTVEAPFETVDCNAVVTEVIEDLSKRIEESGADIAVEALPKIIANRRLIKRVFHNLILNALMYQIPERPLRVSISSKAENNLWTFSIADNGMGIRDTQIELIFKPLRRAVGKAHESGMGMGLAVAKKVVEKHGGKLSIDTKMGESAVFTFTISQNLQLSTEG